MPKLSVNIPATPATSYPILIESGLLQRLSSWWPSAPFENIVIITDHTVKKLYGAALAQLLKQQGHRILLLAFRPGEHSKTQSTKQLLEEKMLAHGCGRRTLCLALGGGVAGDMAGFVAATYMRGIPVIQMPTSLLAMVDSSIGGKTAIDNRYGKNLIGAFWQPLAIVMDTRSLQSLPKQQLLNGLLEAIKMALTSDRPTFQWIERHWQHCLAGDEQVLQKVIQRAVKIKARIVAEDERENRGPRLILNFGHTIGHALEKISHYKILHGYAVAYGMLVEAKIAELHGILNSHDYQQITALFAQLGIFPDALASYPIPDILTAIQRDKKTQSGKAHCVLLKKIGQVYVDQQIYAHPITDTLLKTALQQTLNNPCQR